jgi:hypothetical protein
VFIFSCSVHMSSAIESSLSHQYAQVVPLQQAVGRQARGGTNQVFQYLSERLTAVSYHSSRERNRRTMSTMRMIVVRRCEPAGTSSAGKDPDEA